MTSRRVPRLLAIAALNIDNMGDLLFLPVTERYLTGFQVTPAAPFHWDVSTRLLDRQVRPFGPLLEHDQYDVVWTMGGQLGGPKVGSLDLEGQFLTSAPPDVTMRFRRSSEAERRQIIEDLVGNAPVVTAYIPSPTSYPLNEGVVSVLNSVGLAHILDDASRSDEHVALLRGTTLISVRDSVSSGLLTSLGIPHRMAPDIVHTISRVLPDAPPRQEDLVLFQMSQQLLTTLGVPEVAEKIVNCRNLRGKRLRIFMTGTYSNADSAAKNRELIRQVRRISPTTDVAIIINRRPFELLAYIRSAGLVIGSALHLRIPAVAFKTPRVTLSARVIETYDRPSRYAEQWDPDMPFDVDLQDLDAAIDSALADAGAPHVQARSAELTDLAEKNVEGLAREAFEMVEDMRPEDRNARASHRRALTTA